MAKYGGFNYRGSYYGEIPRLPFSVEPFKAIAVDYDKVELSWGSPQGEVNGLRLVRNQDGYGEWPEDGVVLFERNLDDGGFGDTLYVDGLDNFDDLDEDNDIPLVPGKFTYYRMWVRRTSTNLWTIADDIYVVLPKQHGTTDANGTILKSTHENFMDLIPRVFTSQEQSPLGPVDTTSDLYTFLSAFSFTLDEMLTLADLLLPDYSGRHTNPELLKLQIAEYGITPASDDVIIRQKRMVREAIYMYSRKGTSLALSTLVESLTGFAPVITQSPNLFLSNQDSTFNGSLGSWKTVGNCSMATQVIVIPPSGEDYQIDDRYTAAVTVSSVGAKINNGLSSPVTRGIPVKFGTSYRFSFFARSASSGQLVSITPKITWHDYAGNVISSSTGSSTPTTVSWANYGITAVAPGIKTSISNYSVSSNTVTVNTASAHGISAGASAAITGLGFPYDGKRTVQVPSATSLTFTLTGTNADVSSTVVEEGTVSTDQAAYATVELTFGAIGVVYLDMMQFATSDVTAYYEARSTQIFLNPSKSNFVNDPTFSAIIQDWTVTGSGTSATYPASTAPKIYAGDSMLSVDSANGSQTKVSATTNTGGMPSGKFYTFSIHTQAPASTESLKLKVTATDSVNASIVSESVAELVSAEWVRLSVTIYVPNSFVSSSMYFTLEVIGSATTGGIINFDAAQFETAFAPTLYIDGSFPPEYGVVWEGQTNNSPSHLYKNKQAKVIRLIQELETFLPSNTPYVVYSFGGVETKAITQ